MNTATDTKKEIAPRHSIARVLEVVFQEWVLQLALVFAVITTVVDSVISIDRGTIV